MLTTINKIRKRLHEPVFREKAIEEIRANPNDDFWWNQIGTTSNSGQNISPDNALRASAVQACVKVLAETVASLPWNIFKRLMVNGADAGKEVAKKHPLFNIIHNQPNSFQTSFEFREQLVCHMALTGNYFAIKEMNRAGRIASLFPLMPERMVIEVNGNVLLYKYTWDDGTTEVFNQDEIWHVRGLSKDGIIGLSPLQLAREPIGLALATEEHGARLFSNNAQPGAVLETEGKLDEGAQARLKENWQDAYSGGSNAHKTAVLEQGLKYKPMGFSNEDSQFLETRNFQVADIARIFRVPAVLIGHPDTTMTFASAEQFFLSFAVHTIRPWVSRIEQSANKNLLNPRDAKQHFVEFNIDGLLRGDIKTRFEAHSIALQNRFKNVNEVRAMENLNPIEGGDKFENPNITPNMEEPEEVEELEDTDG